MFRGIFTSRCLRLCFCASLISIKSAEILRVSGIFIFFSLLKYWAVRDWWLVRNLSKGPSNMTFPPASPARGPRSIVYSADFMISGSCSTTMTVFPISFRDLRISTRRRLSRAWRPILGSSKTNSVPTRDALKAAARLILCASPPLKVKVIRSRVM